MANWSKFPGDMANTSTYQDELLATNQTQPKCFHRKPTKYNYQPEQVPTTHRQQLQWQQILGKHNEHAYQAKQFLGIRGEQFS